MAVAWRKEIAHLQYVCQALFSVNDPAIMYPHAAADTVSNAALVGVVPVCALAFEAALSHRFARPMGRDMHAAVLSGAWVFMLTGLSTQLLKLLAGQPRPDFLARCEPRCGRAYVGAPWASAAPTLAPTPAVAPGSATAAPTPSCAALGDAPLDRATWCAGDEKTVLEGMRGWPSGHASMALAIGTHVLLFALGKLRPWRAAGGPGATAAALVPASAFFLAGVGVAISRVTDYRHTTFQVVSGGLLGVAVAALVYHVYYPPAWSAGDAAKDPRARPITALDRRCCECVQCDAARVAEADARDEGGGERAAVSDDRVAEEGGGGGGDDSVALK